MGELCANYNKKEMADKLYRNVASLPIIDYHSHLNPKEIYEDKPYDNIGDLWLSGDHYKWRLMRTFGVDEYYVTGNAPIKEKFDKFIETVATAVNNPIREWVDLELKKYFNLNVKICTKNCDYIWNACNEVIKREKLSPRKLIKNSNVIYLATTDDVADTLNFHQLLQKDFKVKVAPTFRTDKLFDFEDNKKYVEYIKRLGESEKIKITSLSILKEIIKLRLEYFKQHGCKFSDIGIEGFPSYYATDNVADKTFGKIMCGEKYSKEEEDGLKGNLYLYLAKNYHRCGIIQQLHLAAKRNGNTVTFNKLGRDCGYDYIGDTIKVEHIQKFLDMLNQSGQLPETIIYSLNPSMEYPIISLCGAFNNVHPGISWWFNDHKRGILDTLSAVGEMQHITSLIGMLTDSRSFLSFSRHDYFRKLLCEFISDNVSIEYYDEALSVAEKLSYYNAKALIGD